MQTAKELVAGNVKLVTIPDVYWRVKRVVDDPDTTHVDLAKAVSTDPAIAARVLRLVNSAVWGARGRVETVSRAVALLGMYCVHDLVLATGVASAFQGMRFERMNVARFWQGSLHRALCASGLAQRMKLSDSQRPFIEGLLSDIGHMVMYGALPELAARALDLAAGDPDRLPALERDLIGCDYAEVGAALCTSWGLPECFSISIGAQNAPDGAASHQIEAALLHVAGRLAEHELAGQDVRAGLRLVPSALKLTGLSEEQLPGVQEEARAGLSSMTQMLRAA